MSARARLAALLLPLAAVLVGVTRPPGLGDVVAVRHWSYPEYTRVVIELDRPVQTEVQRLPADTRADRPQRHPQEFHGGWGRNRELS